MITLSIFIVWIVCGIIGMYKFINVIEKLNGKVYKKLELFIFCILLGPVVLVAIILSEREEGN